MPASLNVKNNIWSIRPFSAFMNIAFIILAIELITSSKELLSSNGMISNYLQNPFAVLKIAAIMNLSIFEYLPWAILVSAIILFFKPSRLLYLIIGLSLYFIAQRNQFLSGVDMAIMSFTCFYFAIDEVFNFKKYDSLILSSALGIIYLTSAFYKLMDPIWLNGEVILNLLLSNSSYWNGVNFNFIPKLFFQSYSLLIILIECMSFLMLFNKKISIVMNYVFIVFHLGILITLKIPHLSIFMIGFHLLLISLKSLRPESCPNA